MPARGTEAAGKYSSVAILRNKLWVIAQMVTTNAPTADVARVAFSMCLELSIDFLSKVYMW